MSSLAIAGVLLGCVMISTLVAMITAWRMPSHHVSGEFRDVVKLAMGVIGTLTAMVLGLLVASAKGTYDGQSGTIKEIATQVAVLDRVLARYGADATQVRGQLNKLAHAVIDQMHPTDSAAEVDFSGGESRNIGEAFFESLMELQPESDSKRLLKSRAQDITVGLAQLRQKLVVNSERSIPSHLLVVLGVWQAVLFAGIGLLAPRTPPSFAVLFVCMLSVSSTLFLIMELDRPFAGMVRVSDAPLRLVITHLGE